MLNRDQLDAGHHALRQALNLPDGTEADDALDARRRARRPGRRWCELGVLGGEVATWVRVAGNYGPAYLIASPPA